MARETLHVKGRVTDGPAADTPEDRATREKVVLALIPIASRHGLMNGQVVDTATTLCEYIATGKKPSPEGEGVFS